MSIKQHYSLKPWSLKANIFGTKMTFFNIKNEEIFILKGKNIISDSECILNSVNMHDDFVEVIKLQNLIINSLIEGDGKYIITKEYGKQTIVNLFKVAKSIYRKALKNRVEF